MNNFQRISQNIHEMLDFLEQNTDKSRDYWKEYLQCESSSKAQTERAKQHSLNN